MASNQILQKINAWKLGFHSGRAMRQGKLDYDELKEDLKAATNPDEFMDGFKQGYKEQYRKESLTG